MANKPTNEPNLEKFPRDKDGHPTGTVNTIGEISEAFGRTKKTVSNWRYQGMPKNEDGTFDLKKIAIWKDGRQRDPETINIDSARQTESVKMLDDKRRHEALLAAEKLKAAQRENKIAEGKMVDRHDVDVFFASLFQVIRMQMLKIPTELSATYPVESRELHVETLRKRIELALRTVHGHKDRLDELEVMR